jgi:hypothetical protein
MPASEGARQGGAPPGDSPAAARPRWMDAYPRAVESLRGFFAEWEAEREELQAYCSSLAFQVKSLQEENSELRAALDGIGAGVAGGRRRDAADFSSADPPAAKSPAGSAGGAREKERAGQAGGAQGGGRGPGAGPRHLDSNTDRVGEEDCEDDAVDDDEEGDSGVVSDGEERDWTCVFVSARYSKPLHGIDTAAADGAIAIASWDGTCAVFAAASASKYSQEWPCRCGSGLYSVKFGGRGHADRGFVAAASIDTACYVLSGATGEILRRLEGHSDEVNDLDFQGGGSGAAPGMLASVSDDRTVALWEVETGRRLQRWEAAHAEAIYGVHFSPAANTLVTAGFDMLGTLWDLRSGQGVMPLAGHTEEVISVRFAPDGMRIATGSDDHTRCRLGRAAPGRPSRVRGR